MLPIIHYPVVRLSMDNICNNNFFDVIIGRMVIILKDFLHTEYFYIILQEVIQVEVINEIWQCKMGKSKPCMYKYEC